MSDSVTVRYQVNTISKPEFVGKTIGEIREDVADVLNMPLDAQARVGGVVASDGHRLQAGQTVEFVKVAGEKGLAA